MQKTALLLLAILWLAPLQAQQSTIENKQAVQETVVTFFEALSNRDSVSLKAYSTADITLYEYGQVWTIDTLILKAITQNQSAYFKRTNSFEFIKTSIEKNMGWATYHLQSVILKDGKQTTVLWLETVTLVKERKRWKVKHLHSTLIKRM
jgi:ketosteroid isomerase-like protein